MRRAVAACFRKVLPGAAALLAGVVMLSGVAGPVAAQDPAAVPVPAPNDLAQGVPQSPILTLDQDRLFRQSLFGKRVVVEIETETKALSTENRRIEAELTKEERELTDRRAKMTPAQFNELADAFDERVVGIRSAQDAKARAIGRITEEGQQAFFERAFPVLAEVVRESGAVAILDSRAIVLSANAVDITDLAILRIDEALGDGSVFPGETGDGGPVAQPDSAESSTLGSKPGRALPVPQPRPPTLPRPQMQPEPQIEPQFGLGADTQLDPEADPQQDP